MKDFKIIMAAEYRHIGTGKIYILVEAELSEDGDGYDFAELYNGTIEQLNSNNFREIWAGSIQEFKAQWVLR